MSRRVGRYQLLEAVGQGDFSTVYRGTDPLTGQVVAVKTIRTNSSAATSEAQTWREQFQISLEAAKRLHHTNIARVLDGGQDEDGFYIVSEFVEGETLTAAIRAGSLDLSAALDVAIGVATALDAAHTTGVVHYDIKPSNVMLAKARTPVITDFGFARFALPMNESSPLPGPHQAHYRAPEQIYGKKSDERTDIFAFGIVLFEMILRRRPFDGETWIQVTERILNVNPLQVSDSTGAVSLPEPLARILSRALAKDPLDRFQSAHELHNELQTFRAGLPTSSGEIQPAAAEPDETTGAGLRGAYLAVRDGDNRRMIPIRSREFSIGRRGDNDLSLMEEHISRSHARITREANDFVLIDCQSRHGTLHNGARIERAVLTDGDRIDFGKGGRHRITFHSGDLDSGAPVTTTNTPAPLARRDIELLLDVTRALNSSLKLDDVLHIIMDSALTFTGAERGFIMLRDQDGRFSTRMMRHLNPSSNSANDESVSTAVVEKCLSTGRPEVIHDVDDDANYSERESIVGQSLKSIVCVPLVFKARVLGVLYLDSRSLNHPLGSTQLDLLLAFASFSSIALENARLYEMAIVDQSTGVYLKHHFLSRLSAEFQRAVRYRSPLSIIFIDIDHFKKINDTYGHDEGGDPALRQVAQAILSAARNTDIAARWGGDEFVLLAPESSAEMAAILAERLRSTVERQRQRTDDGREFRVTITVGVASFPTVPAEKAEQLVRAADDALLEAKKQGRNRVVLATGITSPTRTIEPDSP